MRTRYGHAGTCRLRWNAEHGTAEVVTTDYRRIGRVRFPATLEGDQLDTAVPFEAVRAIANWRQKGITIENGETGIALLNGNGHRQRFPKTWGLESKALDRVLDDDDEAREPQAVIRRAPARRALLGLRNGRGDDEIVVAVDSHGTRAWKAKGSAESEATELGTVVHGTGPGVRRRVERRHVTDSLRTMRGSRITLSFGPEARTLRMRSADGREYFVIESEKAQDGGAADG